MSFNRPYWYRGAGRSGVGAGDFLTMNADSTYPASKAGWEYNMVRWLEREGYDVTYATDVDAHEDLGRFASRRALLSVGHDEYWSGAERTNLELLRDRGVGLAVFAGDVGVYQVRYEPDALGRASRTMVSYKAAAQTEDPDALDGDAGNDGLVTGKFREPPVNRPEAALVGVESTQDAIDADVVVTDAAQWPFAGTGLTNGARLVGLLGYEVRARAAATPASAVTLAHSPYTSRWNISGHADMLTYVAPSGATVFTTCSIQWAWGLDDYNAPALRRSVLSPAAQQITRNVLGRLAGFAPAPPDTAAPPATIAAPANLTADRSRSGAASPAWADRSTNGTGFEMERATAGGAFARIGSVAAGATRYADATATARKTAYAYRVRAVNAAGASAYSNTASYRTR